MVCKEENRSLGGREEERGEWEDLRGGANWRQLITGCWQAANQCLVCHSCPQHQASKAKWPPRVETREETIKQSWHQKSKKAGTKCQGQIIKRDEHHCKGARHPKCLSLQLREEKAGNQGHTHIPSDVAVKADLQRSKMSIVC